MTRDQIGMFDSGLGGLTVMREVKKSCPQENIVYFGDTARIPYGNKSPETVIRFSIESSIFLMEQQIKVLVIACNTATSYAITRLRNIFNIPIIDVIGPGAEKAAQVTRNKRIAVLGTRGTVMSGAYQREIEKRLESPFVLPVACPLFVPLVEEKFLDHPATHLIVREYLKPLKESRIDTVLLGCTHYPVLKELIQKELGSEVTIVDSASTCAEKVAQVLKEQRLSRNDPKPASYRFFVSDDPEKFKVLGESFLGEKIHYVESINHALA